VTAPNTFGVTPLYLQQRVFPNAKPFSSTSAPTDTTVTSIINEQAAELEGKLALKAIDSTTIANDGSTSASLWCRLTLRLMVAIEVVQYMTGTDPKVAQALQSKLNVRWKALNEGGASALGNGASSSSVADPLGPDTHIDELTLDTGDDSLASDSAPLFRQSDKL